MVYTKIDKQYVAYTHIGKHDNAEAIFLFQKLINYENSNY